MPISCDCLKISDNDACDTDASAIAPIHLKDGLGFFTFIMIQVGTSQQL